MVWKYQTATWPQRLSCDLVKSLNARQLHNPWRRDSWDVEQTITVVAFVVAMQLYQSMRSNPKPSNSDQNDNTKPSCLYKSLLSLNTEAASRCWH